MGIPSSNNYQGGFATGLMTKVQCCYCIGVVLHILGSGLKHSIRIHSDEVFKREPHSCPKTAVNAHQT